MTIFLVDKWILTCFHENGHISLNYGPILKIQNLAYSGEQGLSAQSDKTVARNATRAMKLRARDVNTLVTETKLTSKKQKHDVDHPWRCPFTRHRPSEFHGYSCQPTSWHAIYCKAGLWILADNIIFYEKRPKIDRIFDFCVNKVCKYFLLVLFNMSATSIRNMQSGFHYYCFHGYWPKMNNSKMVQKFVGQYG